MWRNRQFQEDILVSFHPSAPKGTFYLGRKVTGNFRVDIAHTANYIFSLLDGKSLEVRACHNLCIFSAQYPVPHFLGTQ